MDTALAPDRTKDEARLILKEAYEKERKSIKGRITKTKARINELRISRVPESEHVPITEFDEEKAKRFLSKVIVRDLTVTFVFYNGAKVCCGIRISRSGSSLFCRATRGRGNPPSF